MLDKMINTIPMLVESTDSLLKRADFINYIAVPVGIGIMLLAAIFGRKK